MRRVPDPERGNLRAWRESGNRNLAMQPPDLVPPSVAARAASPAYLAPYRRALDQHGPTFQSLLYYNRDTQHRRFEALAKIAPLAGRRVVDFGCGHGDLLLWLERNGVRCAAYLGVDAFAELIAVARTQAATSDVRASFEVADFVHADFEALVDDAPTTFVFSGSLNLLSQAAASELLRRAWRALSRAPGNGLAFNFLSRCASYQGTPDESLNRFDAAQMVELALTNTPLTIFCQHYLAGHDAAISMITP